MPDTPAIGRDLDPGDPAAYVRGGARDRDALSRAEVRARGRGGDDGDRRGMVGGGLGEYKACLQRLRRHPHVREQVDHGLLHGSADRRGEPTIGGVLVRQSPRPHHRAGAKDQGSARRVAIKRKAVGSSARTSRSPVVQQKCADVPRRRGHVDQACGPDAIVEIAVPLIAEQAGQSSAIAAGNGGVSPEAELRHTGGDANVVEPADVVDRKDRAGERIFRSTRSIDRIAKQTRSAVGRTVRVKLRPAPDVLVLDNRPVGRMAGVKARTELGVPIDLVAAQEGQVYARIRGRLHVVILGLRPVLVMADVQIRLCIEEQSWIGRGVDARDVVEIVAILLKPIDRGEFLAKHEIWWLRLVRVDVGLDRAVVAHRIGAIAVRPARTLIQIVAAPRIVCFPRRIAGLEQKIRRRSVVTNDEGDHVLEIAGISGQFREIDARCRGAGDRP